jgi:hypothetical protein
MESQQLLSALNTACSGQESPEERAFRKKSKRHYAKRLIK